MVIVKHQKQNGVLFEYKFNYSTVFHFLAYIFSVHQFSLYIPSVEINATIPTESLIKYARSHTVCILHFHFFIL